jgi:hypothetical protein
MNKFECACGKSFKNERAWKSHIKRCDCGRTINIVKFERMRSPIINIFLDKLFISTQSLFIENDLDRFILFFKEALCQINRQDVSYYIKELKQTGIVLIKGFQDFSARKEEDAEYVNYEWNSIKGCEFFNYIIPYLNDRIEEHAKNNNLFGYKLLKIDDINLYLRELKKLSK